jgi:hypothetical protein
MRSLIVVVTGVAVAAASAALPQPATEKPPASQEAKAAPPVGKPADVGSIDSIIAAYYEVTAGPAGQPRDWDRMRSLFVNDARMIPIRHDPHGVAAELVLIPVEGYIDLNRKYFERGGFFEREVSRRVEEFGSMAQVWSTYESRRAQNEPTPYARGIYSIQLANDGTRWWIVNVMWDREQPETPIPPKYLAATQE